MLKKFSRNPATFWSSRKRLNINFIACRVVNQTLDSAIHWILITIQWICIGETSSAIQWIEIYSVDSFINLLNIWGLVMWLFTFLGWYFCTNKFVSSSQSFIDIIYVVISTWVICRLKFLLVCVLNIPIKNSSNKWGDQGDTSFCTSYCLERQEKSGN